MSHGLTFHDVMRAFRIFICLSFFCVQCLAQSFTVKNLTVKDGLPSSEVYDVLQDSKGFMWFATDNGVARFDGHEMTIYRVSNGLEDPVVFQLFEDHRGRIWFRTFSNRLFYFENGKINKYSYNDVVLRLIKNWSLTSIFVDSSDGVWLAFKGVCRIDQNGVVTCNPLKLPDKRFLVGAIYQLDNKTYTLESYSVEKKKGEGHTIHSIFINGKFFSTNITKASRVFIRSVCWRGKLYISISTAIFEYDGESLKKVLSMPSEIISLRVDAVGHLWVGCYNNGVERFSLPDLKPSGKLGSIGDRTVTQVYVDGENGLWFTTLEGGIFYAPDITVRFYPRNEPSRVKVVTATLDGEVMFCSYDDTFTRMDARTKSVIEKKTSQSVILDLFEDSRGNIWYATTNGLHLLDRKSKRSVMFHPQEQVRDFAEDKYGNVWGINSVDRTKLTKFHPTGKILAIKPYPYSPTRKILFCDSIIYTAKTLGLQVYDTSMRKLSEPPSLANLKISKMLSLTDSSFLAATIGNGLLVVNNKNWTYEKYSTSEHLIADNIYAAEIMDSVLWLGTEKGILTTRIRSLIEGKPRFIQFASGHGLAEDKVNFLALLDREVWAFSDAGITTLPFQSINAQSTPPEFYFKKLLVNNNPVDLNSRSVLSHDRNNIEITFGFLSFRNQNMVCRYRLTRDEPWTYTSERTFRFSSLAPGAYALEVQHSIDNFYWHAVNVPMSFVVMPPWWQQWYVQVSALLILGSLIFLYLRHRYRSISRQQQMLMQFEFETLERERNRIAKELHDGVATNLSAIKLMVSHLLRRHQEPSAHDVDEHFLSTIKEIKSIIYGLTLSGLEHDGLFKGLQNYVARLNRNIPIKIELHVTGKEVYKPEVGLMSFRIIQELLSNAVKHSGASHIYIHLESMHDRLNLVFQDNGIGFVFDNTKGHGLANIQSRINSVKGHMKFESTPRLTSFTISLPLH